MVAVSMHQLTRRRWPPDLLTHEQYQHCQLTIQVLSIGSAAYWSRSKQENFFQKLCPPLTIKSLILVAQLIVGNLEEIKAFRPLKFIAGIPGTIAKAPVLIGKLKGLPGFVKGKLGKKSALPPNTVKA